MKRSRFSESQIVAILKEADAGLKVAEICRKHVIIHTGQNYDYELNQIFFDDLEIRKPDHFLGAVGASAAETVGNIIAKVGCRSWRNQP